MVHGHICHRTASLDRILHRTHRIVRDIVDVADHVATCHQSVLDQRTRSNHLRYTSMDPHHNRQILSLVPTLRPCHPEKQTILTSINNRPRILRHGMLLLRARISGLRDIDFRSRYFISIWPRRREAMPPTCVLASTDREKLFYAICEFADVCDVVLGIVDIGLCVVSGGKG